MRLASWRRRVVQLPCERSPPVRRGRASSSAWRSSSSTIGWREGERSISATVRYAARQFEDDQNSRALAPALTLDGYLTLPLTRALAVEARGENVFDERVEAAVSGTGVVERATPRTLWIGVRLRGG